MILSHRHRFIFLKTRKTGGTSVEIALSGVCGRDDIITPIIEEGVRLEQAGRGAQNYLAPVASYGSRDWLQLVFRLKRKMRFHGHIPAGEVRSLLGGKVWDSYYKFTIERNPWDKVISLYHYRYRNKPGPSLSAFILSGEAGDASDFHRYTIDGTVAVDRVIRFENLGEEVSQIARELKLSGGLTLPEAKSGFRKDRRHYREVLGEAEAARITEDFTAEIAAFGYKY
jgi:hypothetical protein